MKKTVHLNSFFVNIFSTIKAKDRPTTQTVLESALDEKKLLLKHWSKS